MSAQSFLLFTLGPVQRFIEAARTVRDLWSGSYLLSYLTYRAMKSVAGDNPDIIVFPDVKKLPLWTWEANGRPKPAPLAVLEPCIPNRFLAEVDGDETAARKLADGAADACRDAWKTIADDVRAFLAERELGKQLDPYRLWDLQIKEFFEIYTAVLPQNEYDVGRIKALLGTASGNDWSDRHQVAQKMLAAVKNRRHFPVYAPKIPAGDVPQKDTLLGTLEHLGPGKLSEVAGFWETAAVRWLARGSRVTRSERLCAVSLAKRFAWAHHFSKLFDINPQELRYADSATVAAAKWLAESIPLRPNAVRREHRDWSGQWLHWPTPEPPNDDIDEDPVPEPVWDAIQAKKAKQSKPPTYYCCFMFDGDRMGDRFNAAKNATAYKKISNTLGDLALKVIKGIVEDKHFGELIYAGDDAICVLPTETALACVGEINAEFHRNWDTGIKGIADQFPEDLRKATISGGLVVAHYKEDLRFVLEQARDAEKKAKAAGRNALSVTVCRRSGEHSSALVPWEFVKTIDDWVAGFLAKASDRWAYKLRGDLPVIGDDPGMFRLELGRQLNRAEDITRKHFPAKEVQAAFDKYTGTITDFVTLLQMASFLARGRDA